MKHFFQQNPQFFEDLKFFHKEYINSTQFQIQHIPTSNISEIFKQAVYCFLTPATKSDSADKTYQYLFENNIFYHATLEQLAQILREKPYIRFHNQKAKRLLQWQKEGMYHVQQILNIPSALEKREYIVQNINGMNYKEATHFLRNTGMSEDLVILDRHIIYFMQKVNLLTSEQDMKILSRNYLLWEQMFINFINSKIWQESIGVSTIPQADFAIWASRVKESDPNITYERILLLR